MKYILILCLSFLSASALADWQLLTERSQVHFISTKNNHISEVNRFAHVEGALTTDGQLSVVIKLASVETNIDIRNGRMRDMLFNVMTFKDAILTAQLSSDVMAMETGTSEQFSVNGKLSLMGEEKDVTFSVQVTKLADNHILATSVHPVLVDAREYNLEAGVDALKQVAGLDVISYSVPVTFNIMFKPVS